MSASVYLVSGDEYLVTAKARAILATLVPDVQDPLAVEIIEGQADVSAEAVQAIARCREALATLGFFGGRKVVWFRGVSVLVDSQAGRTEAVKEALSRLLGQLKAGLSQGVALIISSAKVDKRLALAKWCQENGEVHEFALPDKPGQAREQHVGRILNECLRQAGLNMDDDVRQLFVERVGGDTRTMVNELAKLATYVGQRREATAADVEAVTSFSRDAVAWDIQDAFGKRDLGAALSIMRRLLFQRESPMAIIAVLESRIRDLLVYREAMERGWLQAAAGRNPTWSRLTPEIEAMLQSGLGREAKSVHPFRLKMLAEQARRFSVAELRRAAARAMAAHRQLVTSSFPQPLVLEMLLIQLLPAPRPAPARA